MRNFALYHAHRAISEQSLIAPIDPGRPTRICYGESERKQKHRAQKIGKSRGFDVTSLHSTEGKIERRHCARRTLEIKRRTRHVGSPKERLTLQLIVCY